MPEVVKDHRTAAEESKKVENLPKRKFRVLVGKHIEPGPPDENGYRSDVVYSAGEVVETSTDLVAKFNQGMFSRKFEEILDDRRLSPVANVPYAGDRSRHPLDKEHPLQDVSESAKNRVLTDEDKEKRDNIPTKENESKDKEYKQTSRERVDSGVGAPHSSSSSSKNRKVPANLDSMSIKQLQDYAAEEEIDLKGTTKREDILRTIRSSSHS